MARLRLATTIFILSAASMAGAAEFEPGDDAAFEAAPVQRDEPEEIEADEAGDLAGEEAAGEAVDILLFDPSEDRSEPSPRRVPPKLFDLPYEMIVCDPNAYRWAFRPMLWLGFSSTSFRMPGDTGDSFSMEGSFRASRLNLVLPLEGYYRNDSLELRLRYFYWGKSGSATFGSVLEFGDVPFPTVKLRASMNTHVLSADMLHRLMNHERFELYIMAGGEMFSTSVRVSDGTQSERLSELLPILTVGLGLRMHLRDNFNLFLTNSALSYSQLFGLREEFYGVEGTYRNVELSALWTLDEHWTLGAGWRHYQVGFASDRVSVKERLSGAVGWARFTF